MLKKKINRTELTMACIACFDIWIETLDLYRMTYSCDTGKPVYYESECPFCAAINRVLIRKKGKLLKS